MFWLIQYPNLHCYRPNSIIQLKLIEAIQSENFYSVCLSSPNSGSPNVLVVQNSPNGDSPYGDSPNVLVV